MYSFMFPSLITCSLLLRRRRQVACGEPEGSDSFAQGRTAMRAGTDCKLSLKVSAIVDQVPRLIVTRSEDI